MRKYHLRYCHMHQSMSYSTCIDGVPGAVGVQCSALYLGPPFGSILPLCATSVAPAGRSVTRGRRQLEAGQYEMRTDSGHKGLFVTRKSRCTWSVGTVSLRLSIFNGFQGRFGPKKAVLGHKMCSLGRAPHDYAPPPQGASGQFLAQNLDLASPPTT